MAKSNQEVAAHRVAIVGGGFGGLFAARALGRSGYATTLLDKRNFHLFQPLLYQVTAGTLTTGDICIPHRVLLRRYKNVRCLTSAVYDLDAQARILTHQHGRLEYDSLIVATGVKHHYFGHDDWAEDAPGLKTIEHALRMRRQIFYAFEMAEAEPDPARRQQWLTFVIVGGGPTGVELAGAIGELAHRTMVGDFRSIDPREARVLLVEGADRVLPQYPEKLSAQARKMLEELGVTVITGTMVEDIAKPRVRLRGPQNSSGGSREVAAETVLWAAGVRASTFGELLAARTGAELDSAGRVRVQTDLSLAGHPEIFVIGDLARCTDSKGVDVPGLAPAALQQGRYVAKLLKRRAACKADKPFVYVDKGTMAVIGRNRAIGDIKGFKVWGLPAWLLWVFVHIYTLIGTERRLRVLLQWVWKYFTRRTGDRLITGDAPRTRELVEQHGVRLDRR